MRISCLLACFFLLALLCACAAPEAALPEPPAAQVQSPEEPPAPVEPPVEPIIEEEPEPALLLSEPVWLLGRLTELYQADETQWAALADVLEAAKTLNADAQLEGLETVQFQGREYIPLAEAAQRLGLEWGEAPDGLRYLARRQTVGQIPEGWNVPVLMYHAVGDEIWGYSDLFVSEAGMEEQLQYLQENGYEPIWFSDLAHIEDYEKPVILTFDDGYDDNYTVLYPLLEKYQTKATIFVIGNAMGSQHKMTQEQVYELAASGLVSIQSHTYTHGNLSAMDEPALRQEMELSNAALAAATGFQEVAVPHRAAARRDGTDPVRAVLPGGQIQSPDDGRGEGLLHICPAHGRLDLSDRHGPVSGAAQLRLTPHHAAGLSVVPRPVRKSVLKTNAQPAPQHLRRRLCVYST